MAQANTARCRAPDQVVPAGDEGAETSSRYRYQAEIAAAHCLSMLKPDGVKAVVCEWHTDFVIQLADDSWEMVSVKHRDKGSWSFAQLFNDGGLAALFDAWIGSDQRRPPARIATGSTQGRRHTENAQRESENGKLTAAAIQVGIVVSATAISLVPDSGGHMFLKSISKLLGVIAMVVAVGLGGSSAAYASPPFDGGDSSCQADTSSCYLYHFKLDGDTHSIEFSVFDGACGNLTSNFTVWRKNSANIWLSGRKTSFFYINFDGRPGYMMEGMQSYPCGGTNNGYREMFLNYENKCWHLMQLRSRGSACDWS